MLTLVLTIPFAGYGQLLYDNTYSTIYSLRNPASQATTEVDAVIFNPAGMVYGREGVTLAIGGIFTGQTALDLFHSDFTNSYGYKNNINTLRPSLQFQYNRNNWAIGASITSEGGYTSWSCADGNPLYLQHTSLKENLYALNKDRRNMLSEMPNLLSDLAVQIPGIEQDSLVLTSRDYKTSFVVNNFRIVGAYHVNNQPDEVSCSLSVGLNVSLYRCSSFLDVVHKMYSHSKGIIDLADYNDMVLNQIEKNNLPSTYRQYFETNGNPINHTRGDSIISKKNTAVALSPIMGVDVKIPIKSKRKDYLILSSKIELGQLIRTQSLLSNPLNFSLGASYHSGDKYTISIGYDLYRTSAVDTTYEKSLHIIKCNQRNMYRTAIGLTYQPLNAAHIYVGYMFTNSPIVMNSVHNYMEVTTKYAQSVHLGLAYSVLQNLQFDFGFSMQFIKIDLSDFIYPNLKYDFSPRYTVGLGLTYRY